MHENIDGALRSLATEANEHFGRGQNARVDAGRVLLEVRKLLLARNGEPRGGRLGPDGLCPKGWRQWIAENWKSSRGEANTCCRLAVDPLGEREKARRAKRIAIAAVGGQGWSIDATLKQLAVRWKKFTDEDKGRIAAFVRERALEETTHGVG